MVKRSIKRQEQFSFTVQKRVYHNMTLCTLSPSILPIIIMDASNGAFREFHCRESLCSFEKINKIQQKITINGRVKTSVS